MELALYGGIFLVSAAALYRSGEWIVRGLLRLSREFHLRRFVVAFFVMAAAASLPNLFLGITAALKDVPELSLGDVFGNNLVAMTLAVSAGVFFSRKRSIEASGETVRTSLLFTAAAAVLPVVLIWDGVLSRADGLVLLALFCAYLWWLFSRRDRFRTVYNGNNPKENPLVRVKKALRDGILVVAGIVLLSAAAFGIVTSASFFTAHFGVPLVIIGILLVGLGNALPEVYFSAISAHRGDTSLIMGNVMGSVIIPATLVLGVVALIHPIHVNGLEFLTGSRVALIAAGGLFSLFAMTHRRITKLEALILLAVYLTFIAWAVL